MLTYSALAMSLLPTQSEHIDDAIALVEHFNDLNPGRLAAVGLPGERYGLLRAFIDSQPDCDKALVAYLPKA